MNGDVTVRDVVAPEYVGVSESDAVLETVRLLLEEGTATAVVLRGSDPVGLLTERDVLELLAGGGDPAETPVEAVMTPDPPSVGPDHTVAEAADLVSAVDVDRLLVLDGGEVLGVLTGADLLAAATIEPTDEPTRSVAATTAAGAAIEGYSTQSICETCGALTRELADVNGQLLCADCRDI